MSQPNTGGHSRTPGDLAAILFHTVDTYVLRLDAYVRRVHVLVCVLTAEQLSQPNTRVRSQGVRL